MIQSGSFSIVAHHFVDCKDKPRGGGACAGRPAGVERVCRGAFCYAVIAGAVYDPYIGLDVPRGVEPTRRWRLPHGREV
jgi:hypothetical protein